MLRRALSTKLSWWLKLVAGLTTVAAGILAAALKADVNNWGGWPTLRRALSATQDVSWIYLPAFIIIAGIATWLRVHIGSPIVWNTVHYVLDEYRQEIFGADDVKNRDPDHYHRVTLFKHVYWRFTFSAWPFGGWMIPVERSGHTMKRGIARFRASEHDPDGAQGVAGQAWANSRIVSVFDLPDINIESPTDLDCATYARQGLVSPSWVRKRKSNRKRQYANARALFGIPIEVEGDPFWGALVVDSRSPDEINIEPLLNNPRYSFRTLSGTLSKLLGQRVGQ